MTIFRVIVRGHFDGLHDERRATLRAEVDDHDILHSSFSAAGFSAAGFTAAGFTAAGFTAAGTFVSDARLIAFSLRYEVRLADDDASAPDPATAASDRALALAERFLTREHIGYKRLRAFPSDMASMWQARNSAPAPASLTSSGG